VRTDERALPDEALWNMRESAFAAGEFVGQESFMTAGEILTLARRAGVGPGVSVLDVCCGVAGPGLLITRELGCTYLGVDANPASVAVARDGARTAGLAARFEVAPIPPLPCGRFDVVLLLETLLAFRDKQSVLRQVASALPVGGRFAFTVEEGAPLTDAERNRMPDADTVWPLPLPQLLSGLEAVGLRIRWLVDSSRSHAATVDALVEAYAAAAASRAGAAVPGSVVELLASHRLWSDWLHRGRVRKLAFVVERIGST
jgi:sarcosine/dimethylglycine N-methyltransferase